LARLSNEGLFECEFPRRKKVADYSLKIISHIGEVFEIKDPYSYGKMIDEFDLQLWGEGNHKKAYDFMGAHPKKNR
jgi:1,4-alpha-glucan branching enzyme